MGGTSEGEIGETGSLLRKAESSGVWEYAGGEEYAGGAVDENVS
jgi:hypothetical protein